MANEKRNEPQIRVVERKVTVTRRTVEVTPEVVLSLLRRCKEIPRRSSQTFQSVLHQTPGGMAADLSDAVMMSVSWEETEVDGEEKLDESIAARDEAEARELDESLAEAEAAVKALPKRETVQDLTHPEYVAPLPYGDDE